MKRFIDFLRTQGERFGRAAWMFYALVFLLLMTGTLALVYGLFGWLMLKSPAAVLVLTAILLFAIVLNAIKRKA